MRTNDGNLNYFYKITGDGANVMYCTGILQDPTASEVTLLLQTKLTAFRPLTTSSTIFDSVIIIYREGGNMRTGAQVSFYAYDTNLAVNAFFKIGNYYVFGGTTTGFTTRLQTAAFTSTKTNVFVMKYLMTLPSTTYRCVYDYTIPSSATSQFTMLGSTSVTVAQDLGMTKQFSYYKIYQSPYSGAFTLLDTMYIPRACATKTYNMTQMDYFYGQNVNTYDMVVKNQYTSTANVDKIDLMMDNGYQYVF